MGQVTWNGIGSSASSGPLGDNAYYFSLRLTFAGNATKGKVTAIGGQVFGYPEHRAKFGGQANITALAATRGADNLLVDDKLPAVNGNGISFSDGRGYLYNIFSGGGTDVEMYIDRKDGSQVDSGYVTTTALETWPNGAP